MIHTFAHTGTHRTHSHTRSLAGSFTQAFSSALLFFLPPTLSLALALAHTCARGECSPRVSRWEYVCVCVCRDLGVACGCALPISRTMLMYSLQMDDDGRRRWWQQDGLQLIALPTFMYFYVIKLLDSHTYNSRARCTTRRLWLQNE